MTAPARRLTCLGVALAGTLGTVAGCAPADDSMLVMAHHACRTLSPGIEAVSFERLAEIRGIEFVSVADSASDLASPDASADATADPPPAELTEPRLVAIAVASSGDPRPLVIETTIRSETELVVDVALGTMAGDDHLTLSPERPALPCLVFATLEYDRPIVARFEGRVIGTLSPQEAPADTLQENAAAAASGK